jgi:hypothetical protein
MKSLLITFFVLTLFTFADGPFKNLHVLEIDNKDDMKSFMKSISRDLGVKCIYCHDIDDKSIDTKKKKIARHMMKMIKEQNETYFSWKNAPQITCWTCHRGATEVETIRPKK